jgi:preprotein translocase subunit SecE
VAQKQVARKQQKGLSLYFRETLGELRKVSWPSKKEAIALTKVVILVMFIMAIFLGSLDTLFFQFFLGIFG